MALVDWVRRFVGMANTREPYIDPSWTAKDATTAPINEYTRPAPGASVQRLTADVGAPAPEVVRLPAAPDEGNWPVDIGKPFPCQVCGCSFYLNAVKLVQGPNRAEQLPGSRPLRVCAQCQQPYYEAEPNKLTPVKWKDERGG